MNPPEKTLVFIGGKTADYPVLDLFCPDQQFIFAGYKVFGFLFWQNDCIANLSFYYFTGLLNQILKIIDIYIFTGNY